MFSNILVFNLIGKNIIGIEARKDSNLRTQYTVNLINHYRVFIGQ